jgi:hypothetical protein
LQPGCELSAQAGRSLYFGQSGLMVNRIEALGDVDFERILRSIPHRRKDRSDGIMTGPSGVNLSRGVASPTRLQNRT